MSQFLKLIAISSLSFLTACASVTIHDEDGSNEGLRFYTPKPYVLVTRTGEKDKPAAVELIYLPDTTNPQFAKVRFGFGTAKMSATITNGSISTFGGEGDAKVTELLGAITGGFKTVEDALLVRRTDPGAASTEVEQASKVELDLARNQIEDVMGDMPNVISTLDSGDPTRNTISQNYKNLLPGLKSVVQVLGKNPEVANPQLPGVIKILSESQSKISKAPAEGGLTISNNTTDPVQTYLTALSTQKIRLKSAISALGDEVKNPIMELYEVKMEGDSTQLVPVPLP